MSILFTVSNARNFAKAIKATALAMSGDTCRPHLNGMLVEGSVKGVTLVCTDGHRLHKVEVAVDRPHGFAPVLLPATAVKALEAALRGCAKNAPAQIGRDDADRVTLDCVDGTHSAYKIDTDERFPPYEKVIPGDYLTREGSQRFGINAMYVGDVGKANKLLGGMYVAAYVGGELDATVLTSVHEGKEVADLGELTAVVMPARV